MKLIGSTEKKSGVAHRAILPDGHYVVSGGRYHDATFPMFYVGKYDELWNNKKKITPEDREWYGAKIKLDFESCDVGLYEARLKPRETWQGGQGVDKIQFVDIDTGAYYTMSVEDLLNLIKGLGEGIVKVDKDGIITARVSPFTRGGTTFLTVYTKELNDKIVKDREAAIEKKNSKLKLSDLKVGYVYDRYVYLGKGEVTFSYGRSKTGHIFVSSWKRENKSTEYSLYESDITVGCKSLWKKYGKATDPIEHIINAVKRDASYYRDHVTNITLLSK